MTAFSVERVELAQFIRAREAISGSNDVLRAVELAELDSSNLFFTHGHCALFAAKRGETYVGRVAASIDEPLLRDGVGHFGFFACIDDAQVAAGLLTTAETWLQENGVRCVQGPVNLSIFRAYRFRTAGFEHASFPGEPDNPAYYPELVRAAGYRTLHSWSSWNIPPWKLLIWRGLQFLQRRKVQDLFDEGYSLRTVDVHDLDAELAVLHPIVMETLGGNYGFAPISLREYVQLEQRLRHLDRVRASILLAPDARAVGFFFGYADGSTAILHTFGISREHRGKGLAYCLFAAGVAAMSELGLQRAIGALVKEGPSHYARIGRPARSYAVFAKELG